MNSSIPVPHHGNTVGPAGFCEIWPRGGYSYLSHASGIRLLATSNSIISITDHDLHIDIQSASVAHRIIMKWA